MDEKELIEEVAKYIKSEMDEFGASFEDVSTLLLNEAERILEDS